MSVPSIACIGVIGKHDNPLHIAIFPPHNAPQQEAVPGETRSSNKSLLDFSFLLNASLDIFDARCRDQNRVDQDLGLLQPVDERLSIWGWQTGTGTRFAVIVDSWGKEGKPSLSRRPTDGGGSGKESRKGSAAGKPVQDADLRPAFKALQNAYIRLLQNPFYIPDDHTPVASAQRTGKSGEIESKKFAQEVQRIGDAWKPGLNTI